jgi:putative heme-binding domain-containing protein
MVRWLRTTIVIAAMTGGVLACRPPVLRGDDAVDVTAIAGLLELILDIDPESARKSLDVITTKVQNRELTAEVLAELRGKLGPRLRQVLATETQNSLHGAAAALAASLGDAPASKRCASMVFDADVPSPDRLVALQTLVFLRDRSLLAGIPELLAGQPRSELELRAKFLDSLGRWEEPRLAEILVQIYGRLEAELQPRVVELLAQRPAWSHILLDAVGERKIPDAALNSNQIARLLASQDETLVRKVREKWGTVRTQRNPEREQVVGNLRTLLQQERGDPVSGQRIFDRICGQCHKIYGKGQDVGPDITSNGRASFEQLLSNVLDPSLVIGASYQARIVVTDDGRVLTGLPIEENEQRVILKVQGGKLETLPRDEIETFRVSELSMMPEGLENQLSTEELLDLFAFILLDKPPSDPEARFLPGTPAAQAAPKPE